MGIPKSLASLEGAWAGRNKLYLAPENPAIESESQAVVKPRANGQFVEIEYTWSYRGEPQEGMLVLGGDRESEAAQAVWTDSWHNADKLMLCDGKLTSDGGITVQGNYSVPGHPDWGWRTDIVPAGEDEFRYLMYNISPEGREDLAAETSFRRARNGSGA